MQPPQPPAPPTPGNPAGEVAAYIIAGLLVIATTFLLYTHTIDLAGATSLFVIAGAILGAPLALKVPSPTQQAQIQGIISQLMDFIPGVVARLQQPPPPPQITIHNNIPPTVSAPAPAQIVTQPQMAPAPVQRSVPQYPDMPTISTPIATAPPTGTQAWQGPIQPPQSGQFAAPQYPPRFPEQTRVGGQ